MVPDFAPRRLRSLSATSHRRATWEGYPINLNGILAEHILDEFDRGQILDAIVDVSALYEPRKIQDIVADDILRP